MSRFFKTSLLRAYLPDYRVFHEGFVWDNEQPRHRIFLAPFALADRPVTNGE